MTQPHSNADRTSGTIRLWDWQTRLFHWSLAVAVTAAFVTGEVGGNWMELHGKLGIFIAGLLTFRVVWGLFGSTYARFTQFFPTPAKVRSYLQGQWQGKGHNPLGALSVFALLGVLALQVTTGLFGNDDIAFHGPLSVLIEKSLSDRLTGLHEGLSKLILLLVITHLGAIAFYLRVKGKNLIRPMLTGQEHGASHENAQGGGIIATIVALALAVLVAYAASGACLPPPLAPTSTSTPDW